MARKRSRMVMEIGTGTSARKLVKLSLRHPTTHFVGVDLERIAIGRELLRNKSSQKPSNLELHSGKTAVEAMKKYPTSHFSHIYTHFLENNISRNDRLKIYHAVFRALQPGGRFTTVCHGHSTSVIMRDLENAGFKVQIKRISTDVLEKLDTEHSQDWVNTILEFRILLSILAEQGKRSHHMQNHYEKFIEKNRTAVYNAILKREGANPRRKAIKAAEEMSHNFDPNHPQYFAVVTAAKRNN